MKKNLILVVGFVSLLLGAVYIFSPKDAAEITAKTEFVPLESSTKSGRALFSIYHPRLETPAIKITDEKGNILTLDHFKGQNILVNFWATWCVPCRKEMPQLDALQAALGSADFKVVIISVDRGGLAASRAFLDDIGIKNLDLYYDKKATLARKMKTIGYPTTILITKAGKQFGILTGPAHWNAPSAQALITRLMADK